MRKERKISKKWLLSAVAAFPFAAFAWNPGDPIMPNCGVNCGWLDLVQLADNILKFMVYIAVPIAAIAFAYAGWLYLSARGNSGQISKAHDIFLNVFIGLVIVLVAWLVVDLILRTLADCQLYNTVLVPIFKTTPISPCP